MNHPGTPGERSPFQLQLPSPLNELERQIAYPIDGTLSNHYRLRWTPDDQDQDLYQNLYLRFGDPQKNRVSGTFQGRLSEDIDGHAQREGFFVFDSITDTYSDNVNGRFYLGYVDLQRFPWMDRSALELVRGGRQSFDESTETFVFDGGRIDTRPFERLHDLRLTAYGGLPVHYFESSPSGDAVVGAGAEAATFHRGRGRVDWTYIEDHRESGHFRNHLLSLALWQGLGERFSLHGRYNLLDGQSRDYFVRGTYREAQADLFLEASFRQAVKTLRELSTELDPYFSSAGEFNPFWQVDVRASKGIGERMVVDGGVVFRELRHEGDGGTYNHEFQRYYLTPATREWPFPGSSISLTGEIWETEDDEILSFGGEVSQRLSKVFLLSGGTYYSLYKFDYFDGREKTHVRTFFGRLDYEVASDLRLHGIYEYEKDDAFTYQMVEVGFRYSF